MILEPFSRAYYLGVADLIDFGGPGAVMATDLYEDVVSCVYASERYAGLPVVAKIGPHHVAVRPESGVPADSLALGPDLREHVEIRVPEHREFLIAREEHALNLHEWTQK